MRGSRSAIWIGLLTAAALGAAGRALGLPTAACWTAAIAGLCCVWWILEPLPIPVTSLVPFAALPLAGVLDDKQVAAAYGHTVVLLLLGGFMLSTAMERSGAHRRLALGMVRLVGAGQRSVAPRRLVLGFMLASAVASMWISNTATVLILLPIAAAVLEGQPDKRVATALLLGVAYAASIGGIGTPIGTPPNALFMAYSAEIDALGWTFTQWMRVGVPVVLLLLPAAWWLLTRELPREALPAVPALGPWRKAEARVLLVFAVTALAWITRTTPFGGWQKLLPGSAPGDATVALAAVLLMHLLPDGEGGPLLDWKSAQKIPWGLLLLFGGGLALARAFETSGLSRAIGDNLGLLAQVPPLAMIGAVCLAVTFLTEVTTNTATTALLLPLLHTAAVSAQLPPALLMVPAAISASCAFMLPIATAPNAIVYGTDAIEASAMARVGLRLNLIGVVIVTAVCWLLL